MQSALGCGGNVTITDDTGSGVFADGRSIFELLYGFLVAQRLDLYPPSELAPGIMLLQADDDSHLINCYITYEPLPDGSAVDLTDVLRGAGMDPARTEMVIPDYLADHVNEFRPAVRDLVRRVEPLSECLDGFLRPESICYALAGPASDHEQASRPATRRRDEPPIFEPALLNEKDWIPQTALVPDLGLIENAQVYLHTKWARGQTPRLCIVVAPAGHGKSKITHILARRLAAAYRSAPYGKRPPLPILISFGKFRRGTSDFDGLMLRFADAFGVANLTAEAFRYLVSLGRVLFILDGYDEMVETNPDGAAQNIADFVSSAGPRSRILLTTRSTFYRTSTDAVGQIADPLLSEADVEVIDLQPFNQGQAKEYVAKRLGHGPDRTNALGRAQAVINEQWNPDILGSPIFLAEFVKLIENDQWSTTDVRRAGSFLEYLTTRTFERERERQNYDFTDAQQQRYLEFIAFDLLTEDSPGYPRSDLEVFAAEAAPDEVTLPTWPTLWNGLASHYFLLPDDDEAEHPVATMRHQVWRDYFQGCALAHRLSVGDPKALAAIADRDLPEGVLRTADLKLADETRTMLFGRVAGSGDKLVRNLLRMFLLRPPPEGGKLRIPPEIGRNLARRDLSEIFFRDVYFDGSLAGANLTGCYFERCDLSRASFGRTMLIRTDFRNCQLPGTGFADADVSSVVIDGEAFFGPQLAARLAAVESGSATAGADTVVTKDGADFRDWVTEILRARLTKFTHGWAGEPYAILDNSISWNAFIGGTDPRDRDFVVRRLYRALRAENVLYDAPTGMTTRPTVLLSKDQETRSDVLAFVKEGKVGPVIERVIARVVR
jgi:uncharacterized protein YjbI with pentapeptide repeats